MHVAKCECGLLKYGSCAAAMLVHQQADDKQRSILTVRRVLQLFSLRRRVPSDLCSSGL